MSIVDGCTTSQIWFHRSLESSVGQFLKASTRSLMKRTRTVIQALEFRRCLCGGRAFCFERWISLGRNAPYCRPMSGQGRNLRCGSYTDNWHTTKSSWCQCCDVRYLKGTLWLGREEGACDVEVMIGTKLKQKLLTLAALLCAEVATSATRSKAVVWGNPSVEISKLKTGALLQRPLRHWAFRRTHL